MARSHSRQGVAKYRISARPGGWWRRVCAVKQRSANAGAGRSASDVQTRRTHRARSRRNCGYGAEIGDIYGQRPRTLSSNRLHPRPPSRGHQHPVRFQLRGSRNSKPALPKRSVGTPLARLSRNALGCHLGFSLRKSASTAARGITTRRPMRTEPMSPRRMAS